MPYPQAEALGVKPGSVVIWSGSFGNDPAELTTVVGLDSKNGEVVVDLENGCWAYLDQILRVVR